MTPHADHTHILALRNGDFTILHQVYTDNAATISSWITKNNGSLADAQDTFQEGIIALHQQEQISGMPKTWGNPMHPSYCFRILKVGSIKSFNEFG